VLGLNSMEVELSVRLEMLAVASERLDAVEMTLETGNAELREAQKKIGAESADDLLKVESATIATRTVADLTSEKRLLGQRIERLRQELIELGQDGATLAALPNAEAGCRCSSIRIQLGLGFAGNSRYRCRGSTSWAR
jgi:chromosome segregation ATPase